MSENTRANHMTYGLLPTDIEEFDSLANQAAVKYKQDGPMVSRFKLPVWIAAVSPDEATCAGLWFSYGVLPIHTADPPADWTAFARLWAKSEELPEGRIVLTEGPSKTNPEANPRLEILDLASPPAGNKTMKKEDKS